MMRLRYACGLLATALLLTFSATAHEGHDHDTPAAAAAVPAMPRGEAASDTFEVVAVARSGELILFLDRFATNEPLADATVAVETPDGSVDAKAAPDGTYRLPAPWSARPGRY